MSDQIISPCGFGSDASRWTKRLQDAPDTVVPIRDGGAGAVVPGFEADRRRQRSLPMWKLPAYGEADVRNGHSTARDDVLARLVPQQ